MSIAGRKQAGRAGISHLLRLWLPNVARQLMLIVLDHAECTYILIVDSKTTWPLLAEWLIVTQSCVSIYIGAFMITLADIAP